MSLQEKIHANTLYLLKSFHTLSQEEVELKSSKDSWSILEILEHIFLINKAVLKVLATPPPTEKTENTLNELVGEQKINKLLIINRSFKVTAPDFSNPKSNFTTTTDASEKINSIIDKIVNHIDINKIEEETHTIKHPMLGEMTKVDWIHFMIAHTNRHILQIGEVKEQKY